MHTCSHDHRKALTGAVWVAFCFMFVEVVGGWIANSLALISDALHLFTDVGALLLSLIALRIAARDKTLSMSYGYERAEVLGALASALTLWALCGVLVYEGITRIAHPERVEGPIVFVIATIGLGANFLMMRTLHAGQQHNLNVRAAYLHVIGDLLGSIGVILSGIIIWLTGWNLIDPIITILFALVMLFSSGKIISQTVLILMEGAPAHIDPVAIRKDLLAIPSVTEVHDLHIWSVSATRAALSAHLVAGNPQQALQAAHKVMENKHHIHHMTIQVEEPSAFESRFCYDSEKNAKG